MAYTYYVYSEEEYEEVFPPDRQPTVADQSTSSSPENRLQDSQTPDTRSEVATKEASNLKNENDEQHSNVAIANNAQAREFALSGALKNALIAEFSQRFGNPISIQTGSLVTDIAASKQSSGEDILRRVMEWLVNIPVHEGAKENRRPGAANSKPDNGVARIVQTFEKDLTEETKADELGLLPEDHHRSSVAPLNDLEILGPKASNHEIPQDKENDLDSHKIQSEDPVSQTLQRFPNEADNTDKNSPTSSSKIDGIDPEDDGYDFHNGSEAMDMSSDNEDGSATSQDPDCLSAPPPITKVRINLLKRTQEDGFTGDQVNNDLLNAQKRLKKSESQSKETEIRVAAPDLPTQTPQLTTPGLSKDLPQIGRLLTLTPSSARPHVQNSAQLCGYPAYPTQLTKPDPLESINMRIVKSPETSVSSSLVLDGIPQIIMSVKRAQMGSQRIRSVYSRKCSHGNQWDLQNLVIWDSDVSKTRCVLKDGPCEDVIFFIDGNLADTLKAPIPYKPELTKRVAEMSQANMWEAVVTWAEFVKITPLSKKMTLTHNKKMRASVVAQWLGAPKVIVDRIRACPSPSACKSKVTWRKIVDE